MYRIIYKQYMYTIYSEFTRKLYKLQIPSNAELPIYHASNTCTWTELHVQYALINNAYNLHRVYLENIIQASNNQIQPYKWNLPQNKISKK